MESLPDLNQHQQVQPHAGPLENGVAGPSQAGPSSQPGLPPPGSPEQPAPAPAVPQKRRPGRPKGSGKKYPEANPNVPKIKRPVGRPRKDGLPAGSLGPRPKTRTHVFPLSVTPASLKKILHSIDPSLQQDDWPALAQTQPNAFLRALITALNTTPGIGAQTTQAEHEAFQLHSYSLSAKATQSEHIPSLYSVLKTFWLPCSPAYFSLIASASTGRTPSDHRFLYWDPLPLIFNGLLCPCCCQAPLMNRSRIQSAPIKVYDVPKPFYIIGCEYVCKSPTCVSQTSSEGRSFASTDAVVLRALPAALIQEFPARLLQDEGLMGTSPKIWNWQALGVSQTIWNMVLGGLRVGLNKDAIVQIIHSTMNGVSEPFDPQVLPMIPMGMPPPNSFPPMEIKSAPPHESVPPPPMPQPSGSSDEVEQQLAADAMDADEDAAGHADESMETDHSLNYPNDFDVPFGGSMPEVSQSASTAGSATQTTGPPASQGPPPPVQSQEAGPSTLPAAPPQAPYTPFYSGYAYYGVHPAQAYAGAPASSGSGSKRLSPDDSFSKRSPRHCLKCGSQECKGKGGRQHCQNPCQDCGKVVCRGRNGRRRDKPCQEGWDE